MEIRVSAFEALIDEDGLISFRCEFYFADDMNTLHAVRATKNDIISGEHIKDCLHRLWAQKQEATMTAMNLTEQEQKALRGELSRAAYEDLGMDLFAKGLVRLDPLAVRFTDGPDGEFRGNGIQAFPLTERGRRVATALRSPATPAG